MHCKCRKINRSAHQLIKSEWWLCNIDPLIEPWLFLSIIDCLDGVQVWMWSGVLDLGSTCGSSASFAMLLKVGSLTSICTSCLGACVVVG
ncbi:hypothetical protein Tco_0507085, partial [Tanacetum coccineum]